MNRQPQVVNLGFIGITIKVVGYALLAVHAYLTLDSMKGGVA